MRSAVVVALLLMLVGLGVPAAAAQGDLPADIRTDAGALAGYVISAEGTPLTALFFEPVIPAPADPGEPHLELATSFTRATLTTGPTSRAVASSTWPGPLLGDGMEAVADGGSYPVKADARYPQGPEHDAVELPGGAGMRASARGLDVVADATSGRSPSEAVARFGTVASTSVATVADGVARATAVSAISDVALLGGIVTVSGIRTQLEATSDGATATTAGITQVVGFVIAGRGFTLDEDGPRAVLGPTAAPGGLPVPTTLPGSDELRDALGIELELLPHAEVIEGADAGRSAGGVRVTIDTAKARQALDELPIAQLVGAAPDDLQAELYPLLSLSPRIVYVLGRARVRAAGSEPFDIADHDPPPPRTPEAPAPDSGDVGTFHADTAPAADMRALPATDIATDIAADMAARLPTAVPSQSSAPLAAAPDEGLPPPFAGVPAAAVGLAVALVALAAHGLVRLRGLALSAATGTCIEGAPAGVPDLRRQP